MQELLVAEAHRRRRLALGINGPKEHQPRRRHAHRLPELGDRTLEPRVSENTRRQEHDASDRPCRPGDAEDDERNPVRHHHFKADRRNRAHNEEIKRRAGNPLHLHAVDEKIDLQIPGRKLQQDAADHAERKERETFHRDELTKAPADQTRNADNRHMPRQRVDRIADHGLASG